MIDVGITLFLAKYLFKVIVNIPQLVFLSIVNILLPQTLYVSIPLSRSSIPLQLLVCCIFIKMPIKKVCII